MLSIYGENHTDQVRAFQHEAYELVKAFVGPAVRADRHADTTVGTDLSPVFEAGFGIQLPPFYTSDSGLFFFNGDGLAGAGLSALDAGFTEFFNLNYRGRSVSRSNTIT